MSRRVAAIIFSASALFALSFGGASAQNLFLNPLPVMSGVVTPLGFQQLSVSNTAVGFTPPAGATYCAFEVETNAVRWRDDGTNPTASVGFLQAPPDKWTYASSLTALKFIRASADATVDISCYK